MNITNWRTFAPTNTYRRNSEEFFNDRFRKLMGIPNDFAPAVNTAQRKEEYEIEVVVPGMKKEDFKVEVDNGVLTISSDKSMENKEEMDDYINREFSYSSFSRQFSLPVDVDDEHINAEYKDGILHIHLPREVMPEENEESRKIPIR